MAPCFPLTCCFSLARVAAHAGCQGLVAAFPLTLVNRHCVFNLGIGVGGSRRERPPCPMAADRSLYLLFPCSGFSHCQRAGPCLGQSPSAVLLTHPALSGRSFAPSLARNAVCVALVKWNSLGWNSHGHRVACPDGPALIQNNLSAIVSACRRPCADRRVRSSFSSIHSPDSSSSSVSA